MPQSNAIQQVFNPATQRTLLRIGLFLAVALVLVLVVVFVIRMVKRSAASSDKPDTNTGTNTGSSTPNPDGTPAPTLPQNLKRLADDLKQATGWTFICNDLRCDTILAMAELPDAQLIQLGVYYKSMYGATLRATFDSFFVSGCCFRDAAGVVDAKLKSTQARVKNLNI